MLAPPKAINIGGERAKLPRFDLKHFLEPEAFQSNKCMIKYHSLCN